MLRVVFTGPAFNKAGQSVLRADLTAAAQKREIVVQNRVDPTTNMLVASRGDTVKARGAKARGVKVVTYPEFIEQWLGDVSPAAEDGVVDPYVDANPYKDVNVL